MTADQTALTIGQRVVFANGLYEIAAINGDLLTLDGIANGIVVSPLDGDGSGTARPRCVVLASDVTAIASQTTKSAECGPETTTATQHTGDGDGGFL